MSERILHNDFLQGAEEMIKVVNSPERAAPAIKMHFLNFLRSGIGHTNEEAEIEIRKMQELADKEQKYKANEKVPTIGTEIEIPKEWMGKGVATELDTLGIHNEEEPHHDTLWEINQNWSYSYAVQARVIEECRKMEVVRNPENDGALSLHVNFGIPKFINNHIRIHDNLYSLEFVNASAAAYSSVNRLKRRKTTSTYSVKEDADDNPKTGYYRFEIRPHEFKDKQAYKMLFELQMLTAGFFAFSKDKFAPEASDKQDLELSKEWQEFMDKCNALFDKYGIKRENLPDTDYTEQILVMENDPEFVPSIQKLFSEYAIRLRDIIFSK
jgi:hypothetical protein